MNKGRSQVLFHAREIGVSSEWHLLNSYSIAVTHNRLIPVIR